MREDSEWNEGHIAGAIHIPVSYTHLDVYKRQIMLTALSAMLGAFFILDDPIFNGLAISLIFGIFVSTLLTLRCV